MTVTVERPRQPWYVGEETAARIRGGDDTLLRDVAAGNHVQHNNQLYHLVPGSMEKSPPYNSHQPGSQFLIWYTIMTRDGTRQKSSDPHPWQ